jgi:NADH-quinone oxidoreductase subunit C
MAKLVLDALVARFGDAVVAVSSQHGDDVAVVRREALFEIATFLRDDPALAFDAPVAVTAIDWVALGRAPRFDVVYQLRSTRHLYRVRLKVRCEADDLRVPSLTPLWKGFNWPERETYDLYGVQFEGHPDLRRILMYDEFVGHPLRKDYPKEKRQPLVRRDHTTP